MPVTGVPQNRVGQVVQDFVDDGVSDIIASRESAGTYTVSEGGGGANALVPKARVFLRHEAINHAGQKSGKSRKSRKARRRTQ